jgi:D-3-phosphoglycerate dehydrogenase
VNILVHLPQAEFLPLAAWDWPGILVGDPMVAEALVIDPNVTLMKEQLDLYPELRVIVTASTGTNHIDLDECMQRDIKVLSLLDDRAGLDTIKASSEFTFLLLLATLKNLRAGLQEVAAGRWKQNERIFRGHELYNKDVGIVGFGRIGQNLFRYCKIFGANVKHIFDPRTVKNGVLEELFEDSDIVVLCCSLTEVTHGMIDYDLLSRLKEGAVLVNTARGEVLVEQDLLRILLERSDLRVGIDVLTGEVLGTHFSSSLLCLNSVTITPHMAGVTHESQEKAARISLRLLTRFLAT